MVSSLVSQYIPPQSLEEQWDVKGLEEKLASELNERMPVQQWLDEDDRLDEEALRERILQRVIDSYHKKGVNWLVQKFCGILKSTFCCGF